MAGKPGRIKEEVIIDEPKPKDKDFKVSESFIKYKRHILSILM